MLRHHIVKLIKTDPKNPRVTDDVVYMTADEEDNYHVAQANEKLDENGYFVRNSVSGRYREETQRSTTRHYLITWMYLRRWYSQLLPH